MMTTLGLIGIAGCVLAWIALRARYAGGFPYGRGQENGAEVHVYRWMWRRWLGIKWLGCGLCDLDPFGQHTQEGWAWQPRWRDLIRGPYRRLW